MMLRLLRLGLLAAALLVASLSASVADHMNGTYEGIGEAAGISLTLRQSGASVTGQLSGAESGTLAGQSDGGDTVNGYLDVDGVRYQFIGTWSQDGFEIGLYDHLGNSEAYNFAHAGSTDPATPAAGVQYWVVDNNEQVGPLTRQQVVDRIASGQSNRQTEIWTADLTQWVPIDALPEFADALSGPQQEPPQQPAEQSATYYLYADGVQTGPFTHDQVLAGINQGTVQRRAMIWQPGQAEWARIDTITEFAAAFPPAVPQPVQYFVIENGERVGPLNEEEMIARIAGTTTTGEDLAWKKGLEAWAPVTTFPEFEEALAALDAPPIPPDLAPEQDPPPLAEEPPPLPGNEPDGPPDAPPQDQAPVEPPATDVEPPATEVEPPAPAESTDDPAPPAAEESQPAGEPAADEGTEEDPLVSLVRDLLESEMREGTAEERAEALTCLTGVFDTLPPELRQMLVDAGMKPSEDQLDSLEEANPDLQTKMDDCVGIEPEPARSEVSLPDGRMFAVVGGSSHSVSSLENGHKFVVDGKTIDFLDGTLTVDGEIQDIPEFDYVLEVLISDDGSFSIVADR